MQYRLRTLFDGVTAIAVILPFAIALCRAIAARPSGPSAAALGGFLVVVSALLLFVRWGFYTKHTDRRISLGVLIGVALGVIVGNVTSLGDWAIDRFNPSLPHEQFRAFFGTIAGVIVGAWFGALVGGIASKLLKRRQGTPPA
jgi:hypothetical protein